MTINAGKYLSLAVSGNTLYPDSTPCVNAALEELFEAKKDNESAVLVIPQGTYHFYPRFASECFYYMSNNDASEKKILFHFKNRKNITVDCGGAELIYHGRISPFVLDGCENITVKNFTMDYPRPFYSQADITASTPEYTDLRFDKKEFPVENRDGIFVFYSDDKGGEWESEADRVWLFTQFSKKHRSPSEEKGFYCARFGELENGSYWDLQTPVLRVDTLDENEGLYRMYGGPELTPGEILTISHEQRLNPAFFITESKDVSVENITVYHTPAMGVIGQLSENITLKDFNTVIREGSSRVVSINADSTHFVNCTGKILLDGCIFNNMLDDGGNVHGIYTQISEVMDEHSLIVNLNHYQQEGINIFKKGDTVAFTDPKTLRRYALMSVESSEFISYNNCKTDKYLLLRFAEKLPVEVLPLDAIENITRMPSVHIKNCRTGFNRPRGFLITTDKPVIIENCVFNNWWSGIYLAGDANSWFESGPVRDVTIRGNLFENCNYVGGGVIMSQPVVQASDSGRALPTLQGEDKYYHSGIKIYNNTVVSGDKMLCGFNYTKDCEIYGNHFIFSDKYNHRGDLQYSFNECANIRCEEYDKESI